MSIIDLFGRLKKSWVDEAPNTSIMKMFSANHALTVSNQPSSLLSKYKGMTSGIVSKISFDFASSELKLYDKKTEKEVTTGELVRMMNDPHPMLTSFQFKRLTRTYLELVGECLWVIRKVGTESFIDIIPPQMLSVEIKDGEYIFKVNKENGKTEILDSSKCVFFTEPNPENPYRGLGHIYRYREEETLLDNMSTYRRSIFKNSGKKSGILKFKNVLSPDQKKDVKTSLKTEWAGPENAGHIGITDGDMEFISLDATAEDLAYIEGMKETKDTIYEGFGISKSILGNVTDVARSNNEAQIKLYYQTCIMPRQKAFTDILNAKLNKIFIKDFHNYEWRMTNTAITTLDEKQLVVQSMVTAKAVTRNEVRQLFGYAPLKNGDVIMGSIADMPIYDGRQNVVSTDNAQKAFATPIIKKASASDSKFRENHIIMIEKFSPAFKRTIAEVFDNYYGKMMDKMSKGYVKKDFLDFYFDVSNFEKDLTEAQILSMKRIVDLSIPMYEDAYGLEFAQKTVSSKALDYLETKAIKYTKEISKTTQLEIRDLINASLVEGQPTTELTRAIRELLQEEKSTRAELISQTETNMVLNRTNLEAIQTAGFTTKKWITARDAKVRPTHLAAEAQGEIGMNEYFVVGNSLMITAGDDTADVAEIVRCRCLVKGVN